MPARPIDSIVAGAGAAVDVLIGTNSEEERLLIVPNGVINHINEDVLAGTVAAYGLPVPETIATYRAIRPNASAGELLAAISHGLVLPYSCHPHWLRLIRKGSGATYMYEFAWRSPGFDGQLGACHAPGDPIRLQHAR